METEPEENLPSDESENMKSELIQSDPSMSPVPGPSHDTEDSMMMMDQSNTSSHPEVYDIDNANLGQVDSQPEEQLEVLSTALEQNPKIISNVLHHIRLSEPSFLEFLFKNLSKFSSVRKETSEISRSSADMEQSSELLDIIDKGESQAVDNRPFLIDHGDQKSHHVEPIQNSYFPAKDFRFKLFVIGSAGTGKSCLLHQFIESAFKSDPNHTIGVEFGSKVVNIDGKNIYLELWDTAGQERFRPVTDSYYRGATGALLVYDITSRESYNSISNWLVDARTFASPDMAIVLVGNKKDLEDRKVTSQEASRFAQENGLMFLETSALTGENVEEAFLKCSKTIMAKLEVATKCMLPENDDLDRFIKLQKSSQVLRSRARNTVEQNNQNTNLNLRHRLEDLCYWGKLLTTLHGSLKVSLEMIVDFKINVLKSFKLLEMVVTSLEKTHKLVTPLLFPAETLTRMEQVLETSHIFKKNVAIFYNKAETIILELQQYLFILGTDLWDKSNAIQIDQEVLERKASSPCNNDLDGDITLYPLNLDEWLRNCIDRKNSAEMLLLKAHEFRRISVGDISANKQKFLQDSTIVVDSLQEKIYDLKKKQDSVTYKKQKLDLILKNLIKEEQELDNDVKNLNYSFELANIRMLMRHKRPRFELVHDHPWDSLKTETTEISTSKASLEMKLREIKSSIIDCTSSIKQSDDELCLLKEDIKMKEEIEKNFTDSIEAIKEMAIYS